MNKSEKCILRAFGELIETQSIEEIKTSDIINRADVARSTFYKYFNDKYDLPQKLSKEELMPYIQALNSHPSVKHFENLLKALKAHKNLYLHCLTNPDNPESFYNYWVNESYEYIINKIPKQERTNQLKMQIKGNIYQNLGMLIDFLKGKYDSMTIQDFTISLLELIPDELKIIIK